jgi:hypothetical protein
LVLSAGTYSFSGFDGLSFTDGTSFRNTFTLSEEKTVDSGFIEFGSGKEINQVFSLQIEKGSTATDYEPYYKGLKELTDRGMKLLWENPSPTSAFEPRNITLDLSDYSHIFIEFYNDFASIVCAVNGRRVIANRIGANGANLYAEGRTNIFAYNNVITIGNGFYGNYNAMQEDNSVGVPYRIYGIKGVSV